MLHINKQCKKQLYGRTNGNSAQQPRGLLHGTTAQGLTTAFQRHAASPDSKSHVKLESLHNHITNLDNTKAHQEGNRRPAGLLGLQALHVALPHQSFRNFLGKPRNKQQVLV